MTEIYRLLEANSTYRAERIEDAKPKMRLAVVTCMDARIDVLRAFGLERGAVNVIRNAGGRVTDDVIRSLALASHALGVDAVALMQHTKCGLEGTTNADLQSRTGAQIDFLPILDHEESLELDVRRVADTAFLSTVAVVVGLLYDTDSGRVSEVTRWERA